MNILKNIEYQISRVSQVEFEIISKNSVAGGDINQAFHLVGRDKSFFVKLNRIDLYDMFLQESISLREIESTGAITTPQVVFVGEHQQYSFLVLEYLSLLQRGNISTFAISLAKMHQTTNCQFGFQANNYIGKTPQINHWNESWGEFFCNQRLEFQIGLLLDKKPTTELFENWKTLKKLLLAYFNNHQPVPALVHGDLWQGNYGFNRAGKPLLYDPACYYGDHEVDLAMLELFADPGKDFFVNYKKIHNVEVGYKFRKKIYNLYHILNHANLFGGSYLAQSYSRISELISCLRH